MKKQKRILTGESGELFYCKAARFFPRSLILGVLLHAMCETPHRADAMVGDGHRWSDVYYHIKTRGRKLYGKNNREI